jgi:hypothetical protein
LIMITQKQSWNFLKITRVWWFKAMICFGGNRDFYNESRQ